MRRVLVILIVAVGFLANGGMSVGVYCNRTVMLANSGKMPVACLTGYACDDHRHALLTPETKRPELADIYIIQTSRTIYYYSIGDVLIIVSEGLCLITALSTALFIGLVARRGWR